LSNDTNLRQKPDYRILVGSGIAARPEGDNLLGRKAAQIRLRHFRLRH
jgi:hypothetical protein